MIASLPMYDMPHQTGANDALWQAIRTYIQSAPMHLTRGGDPWDHWRNPHLLLSQTCGLPYRKILQDKVQYLATPDYDLPNCAAGYYQSMVISKHSKLPDEPLKAAVNDPLSQSGWAALHGWAQDHDHQISAVHLSGAHAQSIQAVADGQADIATIDAVTWRNMKDANAMPRGLNVIDETSPTPGLPFICGHAVDAIMVKHALAQGFDAVPDQAKQLLGITGWVHIPRAEYLKHPLPPLIETQG